MNSIIEEISGLANRALKIKKQEIYLIIVRNMIAETKNKEILLPLEEIELELQKPHAEKSPWDIWRKYFPTQPLFDLAVSEYHIIFYFQIYRELEKLFDKLIDQKSWSNDQMTAILYFKKFVLELFSVEKIPFSKNFWYDTQDYGEWKDSQFMKIDTLKKEIKKLNKKIGE